MKCQLVAAIMAGVILSTVAANGLNTEAVRSIAPYSGQMTVADRAARMHVTVIVTDTPCGHPSSEWGGCFNASMPNEIQVVDYGDINYYNYSVLHELSHVRQWRNGLPLSECDADANAARWGALMSGYDCPGLVSVEEFYSK